jgi:hypothetical protein
MKFDFTSLSKLAKDKIVFYAFGHNRKKRMNSYLKKGITFLVIRMVKEQ